MSPPTKNTIRSRHCSRRRVTGGSVSTSRSVPRVTLAGDVGRRVDAIPELSAKALKIENGQRLTDFRGVAEKVHDLVGDGAVLASARA